MCDYSTFALLWHLLIETIKGDKVVWKVNGKIKIILYVLLEMLLEVHPSFKEGSFLSVPCNYMDSHVFYYNIRDDLSCLMIGFVS